MNGSASSPLASALGPLASLDALFRLFLAGRHLNRVADPALWAELERHEADYTLLFSSLGYTLRVDHRGFAWFHTPSASAPINRCSVCPALACDCSKLLRHWFIFMAFISSTRP